MLNKKVEGLVLKKYSGFYYIEDQQKIVYQCRLRGKIKDLVTTGDQVIISTLEPGTGVLEEVLPRRSELYRPRIANVSLVLIVLACNQPAPSTMLLDRLLVLAAFHHLQPLIIMNKCDLQPHDSARAIMEYYPKAGFPMLCTSALDHTGIERLKEEIHGEIAVLAGPSGAGKSSLLNQLLDGCEAITQEVSRKIGRGRHTTRHVELFRLRNDGWVADTPGFSILDLPAIPSREFKNLFPDFEEYSRHCRFADCLHVGELDCSVKEALKDQLIPDFRYQNYTSLLSEVMEKERCYR